MKEPHESLAARPEASRVGTSRRLSSRGTHRTHRTRSRPTCHNPPNPQMDASIAGMVVSSGFPHRHTASACSGYGVLNRSPKAKQSGRDHRLQAARRVRSTHPGLAVPVGRPCWEKRRTWRRPGTRTSGSMGTRIYCTCFL